MNSPHGCFLPFLRDSYVYLYFPDIIKRFYGLAIWVLSFPSFHHEIMSKLRQNGLIEDLTSTQCRDSCLSTNYYDDWTSFAKWEVRTHIPDFDGLKHYMGVLHMGDRAVLIVKAWNKLTWVFIHRHLGVILRYLFQGVRDLSIYVGYETLFHVCLHGV